MKCYFFYDTCEKIKMKNTLLKIKSRTPDSHYFCTTKAHCMHITCLLTENSTIPDSDLFNCLNNLDSKSVKVVYTTT